MEWTTLAAAAVTGTALHAAMEPINILDKLERLAVAIKTGKVRETKIKGIDTRSKALGLLIASVLILTTASYFVISLFNLSDVDTFKYIFAVALLGELVLGIGIDKYHVAIEKITKTQNK